MKTNLSSLAIHFMLVSAGLLSGCNNSDAGKGPVVQVGNNLDFAPNSTWSCQDGYPIQINATFPQPSYLTGATSCTILTFFPGAQPTVPGTAVSANISVGPVTGPMRFVKMRILVFNSLAGPQKFCCSIEQYGQVFTPTANAISTIPLNFDLSADHPPAANDFNTTAQADLVGIEILAPNVPIPGTWPLNGGSMLELPTYAWLPSIAVKNPSAPTQNLRSDGSYSGFLPAYNLNFQAASGSAGPTAP